MFSSDKINIKNENGTGIFSDCSHPFLSLGPLRILFGFGFVLPSEISVWCIAGALVETGADQEHVQGH